MTARPSEGGVFRAARLALGGAALALLALQLRADLRGARWETLHVVASGRPALLSAGENGFLTEVAGASGGHPVLVITGEAGVYRAGLLQRVLYPLPVGVFPDPSASPWVAGEIRRFVERRRPACLVRCASSAAGPGARMIARLPGGPTGGPMELWSLRR